MASQKSPLVGYNHNLNYKGRVYHVQTEDSGLGAPHVITHLFHDGTILKTVKQEYRDLLEDPEWERKLRLRMQNQHKDMMKGLIRGQFDDRIRQFFGTLQAEQEEQAPLLRPAGSAGAPTSAPPRTPAPAQTPEAQAPAPPWNPSVAPRPASPPTPPSATAPPPPPAAAAPASGAGVVVAMPMVIVNEASTEAAQTAQGPSHAPVAPSGTEAFPGAYRPAESRPIPESVFGSEIISEKSLDEVILSYLSEDMADD